MHKIELANRAHILAEGCTSKETVDNEGSRKVGQNNPGGPPWAVPKSERLVSPKKDGEKDNRQPFVPQPARPVPATREPASSERSGQHERTDHAEDVAHTKQAQDDESAPVNPGEYACQVRGPDWRPAETVVDDEPGQQHERDLEASRACRQRRKRPSKGTIKASKATGSTRERGCPTMGRAN